MIPGPLAHQSLAHQRHQPDTNRLTSQLAEPVPCASHRCSPAAADPLHPSRTADRSGILVGRRHALMLIDLGPIAADLIRLGKTIASIEAGSGADGVGHGRLSPPSEQLLAQDATHPTEPADPADASQG